MPVQPFTGPELWSMDLGLEPRSDKAQSQCFYLRDMFPSPLCIVTTAINMTFKSLYIPYKVNIFKSQLSR